ncbi:hypothetical protein OS493_017742 [Desmophyllum pertusum]|uniref:G-protein coupled receptors family 1 profile domain-containing protein n=1 Tax=Desmophyllum pertusum TaxID=174260 RepID=A0A9W9ZCI6_9CNID|nr:hypothetical protein OS493_017742 [Desmophyllum pertusum]
MTEKDFIGNVSGGENTTSPSLYSDVSPIEKGFKCLAYSLIVAFSVIGNSLIIAAFKLNINGKLHTVNNMFIVSMAAGDLLLTLGSTPERVTRVLVNGQWIVEGSFGIFLCKMTNYLEKVCMNVSIIHLAMVAIDRFLAVFYPRRKIITAKKARQIIIIAWLASAGYCVPLFYFANLLEKNGQLFCKTRRFFVHWRVWYLLFLSLLVLTLLLVVALYAAITIRLWRGKMPKMRISFRSRISARLNSRVLKMVAMIVFAFYCCFLPYWVGWVFCSYYANDVICSDTYVFVSIFLLYANSAFNPAIYSFFNDNFRVGFRFIFNKLCKCCFTRRKLYVQRETKEIYVIGKGLPNMGEAHRRVRCKAIHNVNSGKQQGVQV